MKISFKVIGVCGAAITCCISVLPVSPSCGEDRAAPVKSSPATLIPATARVGNVQVGVTTMEQLEAMFGKGRALTGGHPHGAREWRSNQTGWYIYADGFEYKDAQAKERMVERFEISADPQRVEAIDDRHASVGKKQLAILGGITPGMERSRVIALLAKSGVKTKTTKNVIEWNQTGCDHIRDATDNYSGLTYTNWSGKLTFRRNKLENISIDCE